MRKADLKRTIADVGLVAVTDDAGAVTGYDVLAGSGMGRTHGKTTTLLTQHLPAAARPRHARENESPSTHRNHRREDVEMVGIDSI